MDERDDDTPGADDRGDALSALRALDPAAGVAAPAALHDRVAAIPDTEALPSAPIPLRRRRRWLAPVAAAAAVAVGLGGGYLLGSGGFPVAPSAIAAEPLPVATGSAEDPAAPITAAGAAEGGMQASAGDGFAALTRGVADAVSPWHYSNNRRFTAPPFAAGQTEATVYALDGRAQYSAEDAERIAAAMGIEGEAHPPVDGHWHAWVVGEEYTRGPNVHLNPTGDGSLSVLTGTRDPGEVCSAAISPKYDLSGSDETVWVRYNAEVQQCVAATPMPTEQQARDALSRFLAATEVDETQTEITIHVDEDGRTISATAARIVGGNTTEVTSSVSVAHDGLLYAGGSTAPIVSLGDYRIVSADEAARRLNDPVYAPAYATETSRDVEYDDDPITEPPALPAAGAAVPWGITEFDIASARLGLALMVGIDDERFLAPMYEFTDTEGNVWSVLALAEDELDTTGGGRLGGRWGPWLY